MTSEESDRFTENCAKGAVKGLIEISLEKIQVLIGKVRQGNLSFIEDKETIDLVKSQRLRPEWALYKKYVADRDLRIQIQMGLVLRRLENDPTRRGALRDKIRRKYGVKGLNVAELVQSGVLSKYVTLLLGEATAELELREGLEQILFDIERYTEFVKSDTEVRKTSNILSGRINALLPKALIIFSSGDTCRGKADLIVGAIRGRIVGYRFETQFDSATNKQYDFVIRVTTEGTILEDHV